MFLFLFVLTFAAILFQRPALQIDIRFPAGSSFKSSSINFISKICSSSLYNTALLVSVCPDIIWLRTWTWYNLLILLPVLRLQCRWLKKKICWINKDQVHVKTNLKWQLWQPAHNEIQWTTKLENVSYSGLTGDEARHHRRLCVSVCRLRRLSFTLTQPNEEKMLFSKQRWRTLTHSQHNS